MPKFRKQLDVKHAPQIARLNNGDWGVIFGNGYNNGLNRSQVFILDAKTGDEIRVLDGFDGNSSQHNGMAEPLVIDEDGDGIADTIYAGDLHGNLFKFDISDANAANWKSVWNQTSPPQALPLFIARRGNNDRQPIRYGRGGRGETRCRNHGH